MSYEVGNLLFDIFLFGGIGISLIGRVVFAFRMKGVEPGSEQMTRLRKQRKIFAWIGLICAIIALVIVSCDFFWSK